jgi:hypothetical protein
MPTMRMNCWKGGGKRMETVVGDGLAPRLCLGSRAKPIHQIPPPTPIRTRSIARPSIIRVNDSPLMCRSIVLVGFRGSCGLPVRLWYSVTPRVSPRLRCMGTECCNRLPPAARSGSVAGGRSAPASRRGGGRRGWSPVAPTGPGGGLSTTAPDMTWHSRWAGASVRDPGRDWRSARGQYLSSLGSAHSGSRCNAPLPLL